MSDHEIIFVCPCTPLLTPRDRRAAIAAAAVRGQKPSKAVRDKINLLWHATFDMDEPRGYYRVPDFTARLNYLWRPTNTALINAGKARNIDLIFMENQDPTLDAADQPELTRVCIMRLVSIDCSLILIIHFFLKQNLVLFCKSSH